MMQLSWVLLMLVVMWYAPILRAVELIVCEGNPVYIACPNKETIRLEQVNYGRKNQDTCPHSSIRTTKCSSDKAFKVVSNKCASKKHCSLTVTNGFFGGDPCENTYKYLTVTYVCAAEEKDVAQ